MEHGKLQGRSRAILMNIKLFAFFQRKSLDKKMIRGGKNILQCCGNKTELYLLKTTYITV